MDINDVTFFDLLREAATYGLQPSSFWALEWWELEAFMIGARKRMQLEMNNSRLIITAILNQYSKKPIAPSDVFDLDLIDRPEQKEKVTREELINFADKYKHLL